MHDIEKYRLKFNRKPIKNRVNFNHGFAVKRLLVEVLIFM